MSHKPDMKFMPENTWKTHFLDDRDIAITQKIMATELTFKESTNYLEQEVKKKWPN